MNRTVESSTRKQWLVLFGFALLLGAVCGGTFAFLATRDQAISPWWGLAVGTTLTLGMLLVGAVVLRRTTASVDAMRSLDAAERKAVGRAVRTGAPVDDPRLARAAVLLAEQQLDPFPGPEWTKNGVILMVAGGLIAVLAVIGGTYSTAVVGAGLVGLGLLGRGTRSRARHALEANRRLLAA